MDSKKLTYAEVLKNQSGFLNPNMHPTPLIPKAPKVRLSEAALIKLRRVVHDESKSTSVVKNPSQRHLCQSKRQNVLNL